MIRAQVFLLISVQPGFQLRRIALVIESGSWHRLIWSIRGQVFATVIEVCFFNKVTQIRFLVLIGLLQSLLIIVLIIHSLPLIIVPIAQNDRRLLGLVGHLRSLLLPRHRFVWNLLVSSCILHFWLDCVWSYLEVWLLTSLARAYLLLLGGCKTISQFGLKFGLGVVHSTVLTHLEVSGCVVLRCASTNLIRVKVGFGSLLATLFQLLLQSDVHN